MADEKEDIEKTDGEEEVEKEIGDLPLDEEEIPEI